MRRVFRLARTVAVVGAVTLSVVWLGTVTGVDHRPYFRQGYYETTRARLGAAANHLVAPGALDAGFGQAPLTPKLGALRDDPVRGEFVSLPLAGYGGRQGKPATGIHDPLFAKAVALRVGNQLAVMASADALIIPYEVAQAAAEDLERSHGLRRGQIYFCATHTHSGLGGWGEGVVAKAFAGPYQPRVRIWFAQQLAEAARAALADLQPAAAGHATFPAPAFVRNRLVGDLGRVDPEFSFAVVRQASGRTAILASFAAHATVLSDSVMEFGGDYPGEWQRAVEEATGGVAVFFAGGMGSHRPVAGASGFEGTRKMGRALAEAVCRALPDVVLTNRVVFGVQALEVALPPLQVRLSDGWRLRPYVARRLLETRPDVLLQVVRLGNALWISTPCDFSGELGLEIKDTLRARGFDGVVTSFNGDYIGYVIPSRYYHLDGYEPRLMSFFGPGLPDYFVEMIRRLVSGATQETVAD